MAEPVEPVDSIILEFYPCCESDGYHLECYTQCIRIEARTVKDWVGYTDEPFYTQLWGHRVDFVVEKCLLEKFSSYFRALKSFREGDRNRIIMDCDVTLFTILLKFFYTGSLDIPPSKIATLLETSVFFGVDEAIDRIERWATVTPVTNDPKLIRDVVKGLPVIWDASQQYGQSTLIDFCSRFLAINFISAASHSSFKHLSYALLNACVNHPQLTVDSERSLYDALMRWCDEQDLVHGSRETTSEIRADLLKKVRASLIPLKVLLARFATRSCLDYTNRVIRITHYLKSLDLSGCHEVDDDMLFRSSASAPVPDEPVAGDEQIVTHRSPEGAESNSGRNLEDLCSPFQNTSPTRSPRWPVGRSFEYLEVLNVSQCNMIPQDALVVWLREACPNLTTLVARNCPQLGISLLPALFKECPHLQTLDISLETVHVEENEICKTTVDVKTEAGSARLHFLIWGVFPMYQLTSLSLRGRNELRDNVLYNLAVNCQALLDLDVSMCTMLSDHGISDALNRLPQGLRSLRANCTNFGPSCCTALSGANKLQTLNLESCHGLSTEGIALILEKQAVLETLVLGDTILGDTALLRFRGNLLQKLSVRDTKVSAKAIGYVIKMNPGLTSLDVRGCANTYTSDSEESRGAIVDRDDCDAKDLRHRIHCYDTFFIELGLCDLLEEIKVGWKFSYLGLEALVEAMKPSRKPLRSLEVGVGGNLCNMCVGKISTYWPSLQQLSLCFQTVDDDGIIQIVDGLRCLKVLEVQNSISYLTPKGIAALANRCPSTLKVLKLGRFAPGLSDDDLLQMSRSCSNLSHFSLVGCKYLTARSLVSISQNMRALTELRLEECEGLTVNGGECILESCKALERLILRHNGQGVEEDFVMKARKKLPYLWYLSLDLCDSISGRFETPEKVLLENPLSTVLLSRCQRLENGLLGPMVPDGKPKRYHKDTIILRWARDRITACTIRRRVY